MGLEAWWCAIGRLVCALGYRELDGPQLQNDR